jgi:hypothetical protein
MRIDELEWEKIYPWRVITESPIKTVYQFKTDKKIDYSVNFMADNTYSGYLTVPVKAYDLSFSAMVDYPSFGVVNYPNYALTGTGDVVGVYSTVAAIVQEFVTTHPDVNVIIFTGLTEQNKSDQSTLNQSRPRFYKSRVKMLANKINWDYVVKEFPGGDVQIVMTNDQQILYSLKKLHKIA